MNTLGFRIDDIEGFVPPKRPSSQDQELIPVESSGALILRSSVTAPHDRLGVFEELPTDFGKSTIALHFVLPLETPTTEHDPLNPEMKAMVKNTWPTSKISKVIFKGHGLVFPARPSLEDIDSKVSYRPMSGFFDPSGRFPGRLDVSV